MLSIFTLMLVAAVFASTEAGPSTAGAACDRVAATTGSDSAAGTKPAPLRTAAELVDSLSPGETGCLRQGRYSWSGDLSIRAPGATVTSYPGELATLRGRLRIERSATGAIVEGLVLNGRNSRSRLSPLVYADGAVLRDNEITNENTAICVHVTNYYDAPAPRDVVIEGNRIHHCGRLPATNHDHGIYLGQTRDAVVRDNWIYRNADRGVQLYPDADRTLITGNVIDGNGQGVIFGGLSSESSDRNLVAGNVITNSKIRHNIESFWAGPVGRGNVAQGNCVWTSRDAYSGRPDGSGIMESRSGFRTANNRIAGPLYLDPGASDYRLREASPCASVLDSSVPGGTIATRVALRVSRRTVRPRQRFRVRGRVYGATAAGRRAAVIVRSNGRPKRVAAARVRAGNSFVARIRVRPKARKRLRVSARVKGVGRSRPLRIRVRR